MDSLTTLLGALVATFALLALAAWLLWRRVDGRGRELMERVGRLPLRAKLKLALDLTRDSRVPLLVRGIPFVLVLYLALPLDFIPDFVPVIGQLDDVMAVVIAAGLLFRFVPRAVIEDRVAVLETSALTPGETEATSGQGDD